MADVRTKVLALATAVILVIGVAACGGGDAPEVVSQEPSGVSGGSDDATNLGGIDDAIGDLPDDAETCLEIGLAYAGLGIGMLGSAFGADTGDVEELNRQLEELETKVPDEIADDFQIVADAFAEFGNAMTSTGGNILDPATQQALEEASEALEAPEVTEAQANIEAYLERECPEARFSGG